MIRSMPRVMIFIGIVVLCIYLAVKHLIPSFEGMPSWEWLAVKIYLVCIAAYLGFWICCVIAPLNSSEYELTDKAVRIVSESGSVIPWEKISAYSLVKMYGIEKATMLVLHLKKHGGKKTLTLPADDMDQAIISAVAQKVPLFQEQSPEIAGRPVDQSDVSGWAAAFLYALTVTYATVFGYLIGTQMTLTTFWICLLIGTALFGPGTLGCLMLYGGGKLFQGRIVYVVGFNMLALGLLMGFGAIFHVGQIASNAVGK